MYDLTDLGWDDAFAEEFEPQRRAGLIPGRVAVQHRGAYDVLTAEGELRCDVAGRLYEEAASPADLPAVGDWVAVAARPDESAGTVQAVLPRRTARHPPGAANGPALHDDGSGFRLPPDHPEPLQRGEADQNQHEPHDRYEQLVEQQTDAQQDDPLRTLHQPALGIQPERLSLRPLVGDHLRHAHHGHRQQRARGRF